MSNNPPITVDPEIKSAMTYPIMSLVMVLGITLFLLVFIIPKFEEKHGVKVTVTSVGDAGQVLNRAILEKDNPQADIVVGVDNNMLSRALEAGVLEPYKSANLGEVPERLVFDSTHSVTPFDYGSADRNPATAWGTWEVNSEKPCLSPSRSSANGV